MLFVSSTALHGVLVSADIDVDHKDMIE